MKPASMVLRGLRQALQKRGYRYRGQSDVDTATPWYNAPFEAPNYSQLPERYDWYMSQGFGQECPRMWANASDNGAHERFGRLQTTFYGPAFMFFMVIGWSIYADILHRALKGDDEYFYTTLVVDHEKYPFDSCYEYLPGGFKNDPAYQAHINSPHTY
eukprot:TRINITY_DN534_c6_g1_i1.p1 TRINITY_DN534_c6_g1~~TRINITY_DN534_c6_g1_i1.p1  ORF type:complete len:158 (+),score=18.52 TRINITY_DN534_c6_g1_i1:68-541(+)